MLIPLSVGLFSEVSKIFLTHSTASETVVQNPDTGQTAEPVVHIISPKSGPYVLRGESGVQDVFTFSEISQLPFPGVIPGNPSHEEGCHVVHKTALIENFNFTEDAIDLRKLIPQDGTKGEVSVHTLQSGAPDIYAVRIDLQDDEVPDIEFFVSTNPDSHPFSQKKCPLDRPDLMFDEQENININIIGVSSTGSDPLSEGANTGPFF